MKKLPELQIYQSVITFKTMNKNIVTILEETKRLTGVNFGDMMIVEIFTMRIMARIGKC